MCIETYTVYTSTLASVQVLQVRVVPGYLCYMMYYTHRYTTCSTCCTTPPLPPVHLMCTRSCTHTLHTHIILEVFSTRTTTTATIHRAAPHNYDSITLTRTGFTFQDYVPT